MRDSSSTPARISSSSGCAREPHPHARHQRGDLVQRGSGRDQGKEFRAFHTPISTPRRASEMRSERPCHGSTTHLQHVGALGWVHGDRARRSSTTRRRRHERGRTCARVLQGDVLDNASGHPGDRATRSGVPRARLRRRAGRPRGAGHVRRDLRVVDAARERPGALSRLGRLRDRSPPPPPSRSGPTAVCSMSQSRGTGKPGTGSPPRSPPRPAPPPRSCRSRTTGCRISNPAEPRATSARSERAALARER